MPAVGGVQDDFFILSKFQDLEAPLSFFPSRVLLLASLIIGLSASSITMPTLAGKQVGETGYGLLGVFPSQFRRQT
jgi:hypothetical protein